MKAFLGFVRKETLHLLRDRQTLGILILFPVLQVLIFGFAVRTDVRDIALAVVDPTPDVATLALRTGAPIVPAFALPLARGRYRFVYEHPIEVPSPTAADPVRELTQRCTDVLEMYVRRHPHLWLWMHRRWRDHDSEPASIPGMFPSAAPDEVEEPADS